MVNDHLALVLFNRPKSGETMVALWNIRDGEAVTSKNLPFPAGMLWDWDWRAQAVEEAFSELLLPLDARHFTGAEVEMIRDQMKEGIAIAQAAQTALGHQVHPRIVEARSKGANV
jgi:hypothetical protein